MTSRAHPRCLVALRLDFLVTPNFKQFVIGFYDVGAKSLTYKEWVGKLEDLSVRNSR